MSKLIYNYINKCHEHMLILLKYIHKICVENNIKYTLEAGTLLGAIRDKGFIPWDDDCDISLIREEYEKLKKILLNSELPDYIGIYNPEDEQYFYDFNIRLYYKKERIRFDDDLIEKYSGVYSYATLDIFVMDHVPKNPIRRRFFVFKQQFIYGLAMSNRISIKYDKYKFIEKIFIFILSHIGKMFSTKTLCIVHENFSKTYLHNVKINKECLYCTGWIPEFPGWVFDQKSYDKVHLTDFEDTKLYVIDDYEKILDGYGDWKKPIKTHDHTNQFENV